MDHTRLLGVCRACLVLEIQDLTPDPLRNPNVQSKFPGCSFELHLPSNSSDTVSSQECACPSCYAILSSKIACIDEYAGMLCGRVIYSGSTAVNFSLNYIEKLIAS